MRSSDCTTGVRPSPEMTADHLMERVGAFFDKGTKCNLLLCAMLEGRFGVIPIVNERKQLIGIVSQYSLLEAIVSGEDLCRLEARDLMNPTYAVSTYCPAIKVERMMRKNKLRQVPVVDAEHRLVGIVTDGEILL